MKPMTQWLKPNRPGWIVLLLAVAFTGCKPKEPAATGHPVTIGVSYQDLQNEFVIRLQDAIRAEAKRLNVALVESDAQGHAEKQIGHVENFIARNVDAIILNPEDEQASAPAMGLAVQNHKPIVVVNAIVANLKKADAYVGSPDVIAGRMEASEMMKILHGRGDVVILQGPYGHSAELLRTKGIGEALAKFPGAKIVAEQTANWDRAQALSVMENWLSSGREVDGVIAQNDEMALGALEAIEGAGKHIPVVGIDAIPDALKAVADGRLAATVFQDAHAQGTLAVQLAVDLVEGKPVKHDNYIPFQLVTRENVTNYLNAIPPGH
ncbi:MAG: substrate-binding domain-containing protein [Verrucomicrobiota bacterium]|nr:substrate-binding domain-containing protein [Verrucomicrobiota bacterium]